MPRSTKLKDNNAPIGRFRSASEKYNTRFCQYHHLQYLAKQRQHSIQSILQFLLSHPTAGLLDFREELLEMRQVERLLLGSRRGR